MGPHTAETLATHTPGGFMASQWGGPSIVPNKAGNVIETHEHKGEFKEP
jgi:hypothetical protein